jgi:sterol desaturase/sphingolipid hydroxylase (fatty acid hydroxylase superfamily)
MWYGQAVLDHLDPTVVAIPLFIVAMLVEAIVLRKRRAQAAAAATAGPLGYEKVDTRMNLAIGIGSLLTVGLLNVVALLIAEALWSYRLVDLGTGVVAWTVAIVGWDLAYYWTHRWEHEVRFFWAAHVNHHSSQRFNLSTALRQPWFPILTLVTFPLLALLGVAPWMIFVAGGLNLLYQFWVHTEAVDRMPDWFEAVFNTPSHHRVHHGANAQYLDRNYGGILILWDRLFGTFEPEDERVRYGLTKDITTTNLFGTIFHEYVAIGRDVARATSWRERWARLFAGPGWQPAAELAPTPVVASAVEPG